MSLKNRYRKIFSKEVLQCCDDETVKLLIVDNYTLQIVSSLFKSSEIFEHGFAEVVNLERKPKPPKPYFTAIYFVTPNEKTTKHIIKNFRYYEEGKSFLKGYCFFTKRVAPSLMDKFKASSFVKKGFVKGFKEINVNLVCMEENCFSFHADSDVYDLYSKESAKADSLTDYIIHCMKQMFLTLKFKPIIRYSKTSKMCLDVANKLKRVFSKVHEKVKKESSEVILLLLERNEDLFTPIFHDFSYYPLIFDLLKINKNNLIVDNQKNQTVLGSDVFWTKIRYLHMNDAQSMVKKELLKFKDLSKDTKLKKEEDDDDDDDDEEEEEEEEIDDSTEGFQKKMVGAFTTLPELRRKNFSLTLHSMILKEITRIITKKNIMKVALIEQNIATGRQKDKLLKKKDVVKQLNKLFGDTTVTKRDKLRVLLMFIHAFGGNKKNIKELKSLCDKMQLGEKGRNIVNNFKRLRPAAKKFQNQPGLATKYDVSRYIPKIYTIVKDLVNSKLPPKKYPFISKEEAETYTDDTPFEVSTPGAGRVSWIETGGGDTDSEEEDMNEGETTIVCFVIGGISRSEVKLSYNLEMKTGVRVYLGSTDVVTPAMFLKKIESL